MVEKTRSKDSVSGLRWWSMSTFGAVDAARASFSPAVRSKAFRSMQMTRLLARILLSVSTGFSVWTRTGIDAFSSIKKDSD